MRMDDATQEIDVFWPQTARLGQAQPDERDGRAALSAE
jgi:hypothetical protein